MIEFFFISRMSIFLRKSVYELVFLSLFMKIHGTSSLQFERLLYLSLNYVLLSFGNSLFYEFLHEIKK